MQRRLHNTPFDLNTLAVAGISYRRTPLSKRGALAINAATRSAFYTRMKSYGIPYGMVLSTCNRTEIYTDASAMPMVLEIWSDLTGLALNGEESLFMYSGHEAVNHLYKVMAGADSQIPGDMQITAQVKSAFAEAQEASMSTGLFERIINNAIHCSRIVKTETDLVSGASSVPSAVVLAIKQEFALPVKENIVVIGLGKMGALSCRNILKITQSEVVTVVNRTDERAFSFARECGLRYMPFSAMPEAVGQASVVIVSTASDTPVLPADHLDDGKRRLIFDLSVPRNVDHAARTLPGVRLMDLDHLSAVTRRHIKYRSDQLDEVMCIIEDQVYNTFAWWRRRIQYRQRHNDLRARQQVRAS